MWTIISSANRGEGWILGVELGEHVQHLHRRPVVDDEQRLPRVLHQTVHERPCVPDLAVVDDLLGREGAAVRRLEDRAETLLVA